MAGFPVASIPDPSEMEVAATLSEVDHGRIAAGMKARCVLDTYPDRIFEGRVEEVGAVAAEPRRMMGPGGGRTGFPVRVSVADTDPLMRPGLSVRVEVVRAAWPQALAVPRKAVRFDKGQAVVMRKGLAGTSAVRVIFSGDEFVTFGNTGSSAPSLDATSTITTATAPGGAATAGASIIAVDAKFHENTFPANPQNAGAAAYL